ncbi:MAG: group I truncated hemoglobin [Acidimicrobiia bacterium]
MDVTILERYGRVRIAQIVAYFYRDVLRSSVLGHYFHDVSMSGLVDHQAQFMEAVMGGPAMFTNEQIAIAHRHLGVTDQDFDEMIRLLEMNLRRFEVTTEDADEVLAGYRALKGQIVE